MKNRWRTIGLVVLLGAIVAIIVEFLRRYFKQGERTLPPPDRVIGEQQEKPVVPQYVARKPQEKQPKPVAEAPVEIIEAVGVPDNESFELTPPEPRQLLLPGPGVSFGPSDDTQDSENLWTLLQNEAFRQKGEGFNKGWAFHLYATENNLGIPLARTAVKEQRVQFGGKEYGFQVFARDVLFNEIPQWGKVQSLNTLIGKSIPPTGTLGRALLDASYKICGFEFHDNWAFHRIAIQHNLGPALSQSYRISVDGQEYSMQVFATDTLYNKIPEWTNVKRLSEITPGNVREELLRETYKACGATYDPISPFHQKAAQNKLGTPITPIYQVNLDGTLFNVQVFAMGVVYAASGCSPSLQKDLIAPELPKVQLAEQVTVQGTVLGDPSDALSNKRPTFTMLPVAGQPPISQFYGYTKFAASGPGYYTFCQGRHPGIDFAVNEGTPLIAMAHGLVVWSGTGSPFASGPRSVVIRYGSIYAIYGHMSSESVSRGQFVTPGQQIGRSGSLGGPHLHFELRDVPQQVINNKDTMQAPVNPGSTMNPIDYFDATIQAYFDRQYNALGGDRHFCVGSLRNQDRITFGGAIDSRRCTN